MKIETVRMCYSTLKEIAKHEKWMRENGFILRCYRQCDFGQGFFADYDNILPSKDSILCLNPECKAEAAPQNTYIDAVHFGSTKPYTWRVPEHLTGKVKQGKIAKVKTKHGDQLVEIVSIYKADANPSIHRCVVDVLEV